LEKEEVYKEGDEVSIDYSANDPDDDTVTVKVTNTEGQQLELFREF
jgi:hypothetical protein